MPNKLSSHAKSGFHFAVVAFSASLFALTCTIATPARATDGTWADATTGGLWSVQGNWLSNAIADGQDSTANFGTLNLTADNTVHLDSGRTVGQLIFGDTTPSNNWTLDNNGSVLDVLTLFTTTGNAPTITVNNDTATISAIVSGTEGFTKLGAGTLVLSGAETYTGNTTANAGTLIFSGSTPSTSGTLTVASAAGSNAIVQVNSGANLTFSNLLLSSTTTGSGAGAVYQNGGTVTLTQAYGTTDLAIGNVTGGAGYYRLSGGTLISNEVDVGGPTGANTGVMDVSNGVFNDAGWITIQRSSSAGNGVLNVTGGTIYAGTGLNNTALSSGAKIAMLWGGGTAQLNVSNGSIIGPTNTGYTVDLAASNSTGLSTVNLNSGGVLQVYGVTASNTNPTALLNFNGGTLRFSGNVAFNGNANNTGFLSSSLIDGVFIYGGGATIDNNSGAITIIKQFQAPTGSGLASTLLTTGLTTTGYVGAPAVVITGGSGVGATAVANFNPTTGTVTGITVTNPGSGYSSSDTVTVTLTGGGVANSSRTVGAGEFVTNVNTGGLNIVGGGITIIATTATDTYTGNTTLTGGLTRLDFNQSTPAANIINSSSKLVMNGGILNLTGKASTTNSQTFNGTSLIGGGGLITMSPNGASNPLLLNLGTITRTAPATLNISLSGTTAQQTSTNGVVTSTTNTNGIIGGWATVNGASNAGDWATNSTNAAGGNIVAYSGYTTGGLPATGGDATLNYSATAGTTLSGNVVANSLKVLSGANTFALGSNNLTFSGSSGGLLYVDSSASSITGTGVIGGGSGKEFIIQDWGTGSLSISAPIIGTAAGETGRLIIAGLSPSSGTPANVNISSSNTYTGGTTLIGGTLTVSNNNALGTGPIEMNPNGVVAPNGAGNNNQVSLSLASGIVIPNSITLDRATAIGGAAAVINATGAAGGEIDGNITINGPANPGGHFNGPTAAGQYLTIKGALTLNVPLDNSGVGQTGSFTAADAIVVRSGNMKMFNPANINPGDNNPNPSSYYRIDERAGTMQIGNNNGVATNASVDLAGNGTSVLDLNGFNQTLTGISDIVTVTQQATVTNNSTTSSAVLTLAPAASTAINSNLQFGGTNNATTITDASASFPLSLVINGDPTGVQRFNPTGTAPVSNSYHGSTTLTSGTLSVNILAPGGSNSGIGASSNAASNLIFDGGILQYTGGSVSTDRNFTITAGKTANINVSTAATTLTMSGVSPSTTGGLTKLGSGTLQLTGTQIYTGPTIISAGTLQLDSPGNLAAGSVVTVANTATLSGTGTVNGSSIVNRGGTISPGDPSGTGSSLGTLSIGGLTLTSGAALRFDLVDQNNLDQISILNSKGLIVNGGSISLFSPGGTTVFSSAGVYPVFTIPTGGLGGGSLSNLTIANAQLGNSYAFSFNNANPALATAIDLTIAPSTAGSWTNAANPIDHLWTNPANWVNSSIPNGVGTVANFSTDLANSDGLVVMNGNKTVGVISFNNGTAFNITDSTGTLTIDNGNGGTTPGGIKVTSGPSSGSHTISVPMVLNSEMDVDVNDGASVTLAGKISNGTQGTKNLVVENTVGTQNTGVVILTASNNAYGATFVNAATLQVGSGSSVGSLGTGNATIAAGAILSFNSSSPQTATNNLLGATGTVAYNGSSSLTLSPTTANTFGTATGGGLVVNSGSVKVGNVNAIPAALNVTVNAGTFDTNGFNTTVQSLNSLNPGGTVTDNSSTAGTTILTVSPTGTTTATAGSYAGVISDGPTRPVVLTIAGTSDTAAQILTGTSTAATTQITHGTLVLGNTSTPVISANNSTVKLGDGTGSNNVFLVTTAQNQFANSTVLNFNDGTANDQVTNNAKFLLRGNPQTIAGLTSTDNGGTSISIVENDENPSFNWVGGAPSTTLTLDGSGNYTFFGIIRNGNGTANAGSLGITMNGTGTQTLINRTVNGGAGITYNGATTINSGELILNLSGASANAFNSSVQINAGTLGLDGTWTMAATLGINGSGNVIKQGTGTVTLANQGNDYTGSTTLLGGVLQVAAMNTAGSGSSIGTGGANDGTTLVFGGGALQYTGTSPNTSDFKFTMTNGVDTMMDVSTAGATLTMTGNAVLQAGESSTPANFVKGIQAGAGGAGTLIVSGNLNYHGNTSVNSGALLVDGPGSIGTTGFGTVTIASGATLGGTGSIGGVVGGASGHTTGIIAPGDPNNNSFPVKLTFRDPLKLNGGTIQYNIDAAASFVDSTTGPITVNDQNSIFASGGLSYGATNDTLDLEFKNPSSLQVNDIYYYKALTFTGSPTGTQGFNFKSNIGRSLIQVSPSSPAGEIDLKITVKGAANLTWNSTSSGAWDIQTTANWFNGTGSDSFFQNDNVTFGDNNSHSTPPNGQLQTALTLNDTVLPTSVTYSGSANSYTISGTGKISGPATVTVNGGTSNSTLTLQTNNDYTGNTTINSGTLVIGGATATAGSLGNGQVTVNGGTLNIGGGGSAGTFGTGSVTVNSPGTLLYARSDSTTFAPASLNGNGSLAFATSGEVIQNIDLSSFSGTLTVQSGTLRPANANNPLAATNNIVQNGGEIYFDTGSNHAPPAVPITINGTGTGASGSNNDGAIRVGSATLTTLSGVVTVGSNALIGLDGGATLSLTATPNALVGSNVTLSLTGGGTLSVSGNVNLGASGALATGTSPVTLAPNPSSTINISSPITGGGAITANTAGTPNQTSLGTTTLVDNPAYTGAITVNTGNLQVSTANGLGTTAGNTTLSGGAGAINGSLLIKPSAASLTSISIPENFTLAGRQGTAIDVPHIENVDGNNTLTGTVTLNVGGNDFNLQSDAGSLTVQSGITTSGFGLNATRNLKLLGAGNGAITGVLSDTANNPLTVVKSGAGKWTIGNSTTPISLLSGLTINDSGTLGIATSSSVTVAGVLNVATASATPHIALGSTGADTGSSLTANGGITLASSDAVLSIDNWTYGVAANGDHVNLGTTSPPLSVLQTQIHFSDFALGASYTSVATAARSVGEITPLIGDVNQDGHVDVRDVTALMKALTDIGSQATAGTDLNSYAHLHPSFTNSDILFALDVNGDGVDNNADIQALLNYLIAGNGSTAPVPEPGSIMLLTLGALLVGARYRSRGGSK